MQLPECRLQIRVSESWASLTKSPSAFGVFQVPHVHARAALAGSFYLDCGSEDVLIERSVAGPKARALGNQSTCGIFLEDPRTPAAVADMPESLRLRLGWGEAQTFQLPRGSLLLYPGWLQHAPSPRWSSSEMGEGEASARRQRVAVSFTIAVQLRDGSVGSSRATG
ncbi:unnamed protein product, partial [Polarella glacialis]